MMSINSIIEFEEKLNSKRKEFTEELKKLIEVLKTDEIQPENIQSILNNVEEKANDYFEYFENSITEYDIDYFEKNKNILFQKVDSTVNNLNTILIYKRVKDNIGEKYNILIPKAGERAFSTMQRLLNTFDPEKSKLLKIQFKKANLPIYGFDKYWFMDNSKQIKLGVILGTAFLLILLGIILYVKCPTAAQNNIFSIVLALAGAAFSMVLTGQIKVKYQNTITAGGALAVFLLIFLWKPTQIDEFTNCPNKSTLSATVYYGNNPESNIDILLVKKNIHTNTNINGNFSIDINNPDEDDFKVRLTKRSIQLDTTIVLSKSNFDSSLDIKINQFCVECKHKDSLNNLIRKANKCSAKEHYINDFKTGYKKAGNEQNLITECIYSKN